MPVIMGRKTFETLSGKPLAGRTNIVIKRDSSLSSSYDNVHFVTSIELAVQKAAEADCKEIFIIGGGEIYTMALPMADSIYLTRVHTTIEGDTYFPVLGTDWIMESSEPHLADKKHAFNFDFEIWHRK
jgi:dihydrofolate reductase